ncbi:hypothetical protein PVK06_002746 [Gossypium arboreum]|uniref:Uncharacterized protein n=1 Tax=Gossypium arboreum TaxID=29729 RepID=A0ABR0R5I1_GOSAR|nr:hypothetical protein PVK06_002746 [Gossypium arboreum]
MTIIMKKVEFVMQMVISRSSIAIVILVIAPGECIRNKVGVLDSNSYNKGAKLKQKAKRRQIGLATPPTQGQTSDKGKGVLEGTHPGFPPKELLLLSLMMESSPIGIHSRASTLDSMGRNFNFECPRFDGEDFRGWWSKLEQFFEVEGVLEQDNVRIVMLHMEGKALD